MSSYTETDASGAVNYDCAPLLEVAIDDVEYRIDAGKQGTSMCLSTRVPGTWDWAYHGEVRFDGRDLRSKTLERQVRERLSNALVTAIRETEE